MCSRVVGRSRTFMFQEFIVFRLSGLILFSWRQQENQVAGNAVATFIEELILRGRSGENFVVLNGEGKIPCCLQWKQDANSSLAFLITFPRDHYPERVTHLLDVLHRTFIQHYEMGLEGAVTERCRQAMCNLLESGADCFRSCTSVASHEDTVKYVRNQATLNGESHEHQQRAGERKDTGQRDVEAMSIISHHLEGPDPDSLPNVSISAAAMAGTPTLRIANVAGSRTTESWLPRLVDKTLIDKMLGKKVIKQEDLNPIINRLREVLLAKNVATLIVEQVCTDTCSSLLGKPIHALDSIRNMIDTAIKKSLRQTLSQSKNINLLTEINVARAKKTPYTITFIGVNGVGKSTSLSKVASWLLSNGFSVLVAACDTFRAGAVEQLRTHCQRLQIPLYERGYEKDPAKIAQEAIIQAKRQAIDVVLIDTAGRMQDNEPLMRSLSKLISVNSPELVLFVGEALVGNDAVDQLQKFNSALADLDKFGRKRLIDGIIVSKFDTIDNKVGALLSMVLASGAPVLFIGCGQTYQDLKVPNIDHLIDSLLI